MEVVDANSANSGVQKSATAIAESVQEEVKSNDNGTTTTTTTTVTKTTKEQNGSPPTSNDDKQTLDDTTSSSTTTTVKVTKKPIKKEVKINDEIVKIEDVPNENDDNETEIIEIIEGDESGEEVEIVETVILKKTTPPSLDNNNNNNNNNDDKSMTTTETITTKKNIINKQNSNDSTTTATDTEITIKLNKPKIESSEIIQKNESIKEEIIDEKNDDKEQSPIKNVIVESKKEEELPKKEDSVPKSVEKKPEEIVEKEVEQEELEEEEEEEEEEVIEEVEEEEEQQPQKGAIADKVIIAQKPPLPISVVHQQQQLQEEQQRIQQKEDIPIVQHQQRQQQQQQQQQQQYQMQQPQVGQHEKQQKYNDNTILYGRSPPSLTEIKQENIKNQLKEIISDIDRVIEQEEDKTSTIPQQQHQYQQRQYQPPNQYSQQQQQQHQVSSTTTREESQDDGYSRKMERTERNEIQGRGDGTTQIRSTTTSTTLKSTPQIQYDLPSGQNIYHYAPPPSTIKSYDQMKGHRSMSLPSPYAVEQSSTSSTTKTIDLQKIFTPATDYEEISPKNRKLYSSSAFYSPNLHPTVEDQVELARRISHSLSDISNQQSKGQSMYVNRKKRSVKWVHEGEGKAQIQDYNTGYHGYEGHKENEYEHTTYHDKVPLKLVMNPRGQVRDFTSVRQDYNQESSGLLSPDKCAELVAGLNAPKGKGAELFAKRRKKSEKWIVDETNAAQQSPSGVQPYGAVSPNILPAYSDVGVQRVQLNMHQDQVQDKYAQPRIKMVKTPWEAALETGSASAAFQEVPNLKKPASFVPQQSTGYDYSNYTPLTYQKEVQQLYYPPEEYQQFPKTQQQQQQQSQHQQPQQQKSWQPNSQRDLAYKPSIPQGWNAPPTSLPKELYVPKEIPLDGYIPPSTEKYLPANQSAYSSLPPPSTSLYNNQHQSNDYSSSSYQQQQQLSSSMTSSDLGGGGGGGVCGSYNSGNIGLSTSPIPQKTTFPISQQYSTSYLGGYGNTTTTTPTSSTLAPRSVSPYYQQPSVSGGVASTAATFNNYNKQSTSTTFPIKSPQYYSAPPTNKQLNNWKTQPNLSNQTTPVNFNPSPLPYEKLAKFQQPDPIDSDYGFRVPIPGIRRPLAIPIGVNKIRNLSPLPYYSTTPQQSASSKSYTQQSTTTTSSSSTTQYQTTQQQDKQQYSNQYYNDSNKYLSNYGAGGDVGGVGNVGDLIGGSSNINSKLIDLSNCHNYNTAARGWGQTKNCYKPITFTKSPIAADMPYTDF